MMMRSLITTTFLFLSLVAAAQWVESPTASCQNPKFTKEVNKWISYTVDVISVTDLKDSTAQYLILDARELDEYLVSHIPGAIHIGHEEPKWDALEKIDKDRKIVIYCSIGYRSEIIGEQLIKKGYTNTRNLYGSIFEWANQGCNLEDPRDRLTNRVHTYNKKWSKWLDNTDIQKVY